MRSNKQTKIQMVMDSGEKVIVVMYENPTTQDFLSRLPLTTSFEDYIGKEKISYLDQKLATQKARPHTTPKHGDFTYYSPWGNLAVFYKGNASEGSVIIMGKIEAGKEHLKKQRGSFQVKIELIEE